MGSKWACRQQGSECGLGQLCAGVDVVGNRTLSVLLPAAQRLPGAAAILIAALLIRHCSPPQWWPEERGNVP